MPARLCTIQTGSELPIPCVNPKEVARAFIIRIADRIGKASGRKITLSQETLKKRAAGTTDLCKAQGQRAFLAAQKPMQEDPAGAPSLELNLCVTRPKTTTGKKA